MVAVHPKARSTVDSPLRPHAVTPILDRRRPTLPRLSTAPTVAAIVPARNEQDTVGASIAALLDQTRPPDSIFVVVNNSTDDTYDRARRFTGRRTLDRPGGRVACAVTVIDIGTNDDRRAGALNFAWSLARHHDFVLTVDADSALAPDGLRTLLADLSVNEGLGAVTAVPSLLRPPAHPGDRHSSRLLVRAQRFEVTTQALRSVARSGRVPISVGQCSLFRTSALGDVVVAAGRPGPWGPGNGAEDARLRIDLDEAGFATGVSDGARSSAAAMRTARGVRAQQVKRVAGLQRLGRELPAASRLSRRFEWRSGLAGHLVSRLLFVLLVSHALVTGTVAGQWWWIVPSLITVLVSLRVVAAMPDRSAADIVYALLYLPHEIYRTALSLSHVIAVVHESAGCARDHGADQAAAECGERVRVTGPAPVMLVAVGAAALVVLLGWLALPGVLGGTIVAAGWLALGLLGIGQSLAELRTLVGRPRLPVLTVPSLRAVVPR
ncbi:glycosyltransferase [Microbacteriaceae bacterium 4G12]